MMNAFTRFEASRYGYQGAPVDPFERRRTRIGEDILKPLDGSAQSVALLHCNVDRLIRVKFSACDGCLPCAQC